MVISMDIGNTNVTIGVYEGEQLMTHWRIPSTCAQTADGVRHALQDLFVARSITRNTVEGVIACSVVPSLQVELQKAIQQLLDQRVIMAGTDVDIPISNRYGNPTQVGTDRLINAYGGQTRYGVPLVIIDFGTAITIDVVATDGAYVGGVITPGIEISLEALASRTALLPRVGLDVPAQVLGTSTEESIQSGMLYGYADMCDGLVRRLKREVSEHAKVVATGGYAEMIVTHCKSIDYTDNNLTIDGLHLLWKSLHRAKSLINSD
jgi:type III pantothenate kinase